MVGRRFRTETARATIKEGDYIFAIDGNGDLQSLTDQAGFIAQQYLKPNEIVDFLRLNNKGGISDYFLKETKPFYTK